ncbi:hypothetical protein LX86_001432 [Lentzea aerocolonigenes]|nr:hypothetical protein [Lentzea aerocolonigenes]
MTDQRPDGRLPNPNGCRWCGADRHGHDQRWVPGVKWHGWEPPTSEQRKHRMLARRARRPDCGRGATDLLAS